MVSDIGRDNGQLRIPLVLDIGRDNGQLRIPLVPEVETMVS